MPWDYLRKYVLSDLESKSEWKYPSDIKIAELPGAEKEITQRLRSFINEAFESQVQVKILINILKLIEPIWKTNNLELLHLRQKILLEFSRLCHSFIRKNSTISSRTIYEFQKKSKRDTILLSPPKKCDQQLTPRKVIKKFH